MSKRRKRGMRKSFPVGYSADRVKVKLGVNKLVHSDLYRKKQLDQEYALWGLVHHPSGEARLAALQRISDFIMEVPQEHRLLIESGGENYKLMLCWYINEFRQTVYFFVRELRSHRSHTIEKSITYVRPRGDVYELYKKNKITWTAQMNAREPLPAQPPRPSEASP